MAQDFTPVGASQRSVTSLPFNLSAIALLLLLFGIGVSYMLDDMAGEQSQDAPSSYTAPFVSQILGGKTLLIPADWFHPPAPASGEFSDQIDLQIGVRLSPDASPAPIDIRLTPASGAQPSAYLLDTVYIKQFTSEQVSGPVGLVGKPLRSEEGFQNETVWYDPLSPRPFVAKCISAVKPERPASCLRTVYLPDQIAVTYQFPSDQLAYWRQFDAAMEPWLLDMGLTSNI